jgi:CRP-like cAMP-binding protein
MVKTKSLERHGMGIMRTRGTNDEWKKIRMTELFSDCSPKECRTVSRLTTVVEVPAGRVLMFEGDAGRECFVIVSGQAIIERDGVILGHAIDGAVVGELALVDKSARTATVTAVTPMRLLVMSVTEFRTLCDAVPSLKTRFAETAEAHRRQLEAAFAVPAAAEPDAPRALAGAAR